ncbi:15739_t:CDS:2 [Dentiscutata erythropus]|uniref:15739_t:CDS:1 n=1 Tax=Dentiscutata erythropus TaxID=1348616 RepID=A0A9N9NWD2_9GLOM|nr:15739_t:CDS:2 [Dentiscutata erythropus]
MASERVCQLEDEVRKLRNQITHKDISFDNIKGEIATKLEEIRALQSRVEELEQSVSLVQKELTEMDSFKRKLELENTELFTKNIYLDLEKKDLEDTLAEKKNELAQMKDNLVTTQRALIEKDTLLQEAVLNKAHLAEQIPKTSSESEVAGGS